MAGAWRAQPPAVRSRTWLQAPSLPAPCHYRPPAHPPPLSPYSPSLNADPRPCPTPILCPQLDLCGCRWLQNTGLEELARWELGRDGCTTVVKHEQQLVSKVTSVEQWENTTLGRLTAVLMRMCKLLDGILHGEELCS